MGDLNSHGHTPNRFSYHYSFHYPFGLWSGLYLHHTFRFRCSPSSLYTFILRCLARDCHFTGFPEFDRIHTQSFPLWCSIFISQFSLPVGIHAHKNSPQISCGMILQVLKERQFHFFLRHSTVFCCCRKVHFRIK